MAAAHASRFVRHICVVIALALVSSTAVLGAASAADGKVGRSRSAVLGYVESGDGQAALRRDLHGLTDVGVDGVNISASGAHVSRPDGDARAMLRTTHRAHERAELLVGNYSNRIGDFDRSAAHRLFASARHRRTVIAGLVADARHGWNGIQLDFESLHRTDRTGLTRFTRELRAALPAKCSLSMAVMASTTARGYRDAGYNLHALAGKLDRVILMAYDQHGPTWSKAGPIGGLPWAERAMRTMLESVPRHKAVLGVAGYGYTWPAHRVGTQLGDAAARRAATSATWDARQAEWHSALRGGGSLWWSDARSLHIRRALARRMHVAGVAVWSVGLSDKITR